MLPIYLEKPTSKVNTPPGQRQRWQIERLPSVDGKQLADDA
jgi:hypothetical protein